MLLPHHGIPVFTVCFEHRDIGKDKKNQRVKIMKPIISIIVPVYKVESYLDICLKSLINQTFRDIEIILIDDGSPDNCPEMCDRYAKENLRVKVIHKENGGLSDARNAGIREAKGEYVLFVDSDDYIDIDTCERFIEVIGQDSPDIVVGNARRVEDGKITIMQHQFNTFGQSVTGEQYLKNELKSGTMYMAAWLNLYNRSFIINNELEFKKGLLHEDEQFTPRAFLKADKVKGTDIVFYSYIIREDSITMGKDLTLNGVHIIKICYELSNIYDKIDDDDLKNMLGDLLVSKYLYGFQIGRLYRREYETLIDRKFVWKHASSPKNKAKAFLFILSKKMYFYLNKTTKTLNN
jgi:glycosyltransferase involved in cell wall biosynthesis